MTIQQNKIFYDGEIVKTRNLDNATNLNDTLIFPHRDDDITTKKMNKNETNKDNEKEK